MSLKATLFRDRLKKKAKRGYQGHPVATIAYYGPDDKQANKVAVGIIQVEKGEVEILERWFSKGKDARVDPEINEAIIHLLQRHGVKSVISPDRIIGCPHEEGIDYPDGEKCPVCKFWTNRDRFSGKTIQ
ncbi:hypothetical protein [Methyloglobulus sp.]|uniref:hypothetical protein n=1 Tax=Methyloglobulus sp. TaxID=2518622 RepID=UPI003988D443